MAFLDRVVTVSTSGGAQFGSIGLAMAAITEASAELIYHILVVGDVLEPFPVTAKSYVNVVGLPGHRVVFNLTDPNQSCIKFANVTGAFWRGLEIIREGTFTTSEHSMVEFSGLVDDSVHLEECRFYDRGSASSSELHSFPLFSFEDAASPEVLNCWGQYGAAGTYSHGIVLSGAGASPKIEGCTLKPASVRKVYVYDSGELSFSPVMGKPYQVRSCVLSVLTSHAGASAVLKFSGSETAFATLSLESTGTQTVEIAGDLLEVREAGEGVDVEVIGAVGDGDFTLTFLSDVVFANSSAVKVETKAGFMLFDCIFYATNAAPAMSIELEDVDGVLFKIHESYFERALGEGSERGDVVVSSILFDPSPVYNCTVSGSLYNISFKHYVVEADSVMGCVVNDEGVHSDTVLWTSERINSFVRSLVQGLDWQASVISRSFTVPPYSVEGDRYLIPVGATGAWADHVNQIAEYTSADTWWFCTLSTGMCVYIEDEYSTFVWNGTSWVVYGTVINHGALEGLQGGDETSNYHLSLSEYLALTSGEETELHSHPLDSNSRRVVNDSLVLWWMGG